MQSADIATDERRMREYLLGLLPAAESQLVEESLLESEELFEALHSAEDDLVDDFAAGRLTEAESAAFVARYGTADARQRVVFANALQSKVEKRQVVQFKPRSHIPMLSAAAAAVIAVTALFFARNTNLPESLPSFVRSARTIDMPAAPLVRTVTATIVLGSSRGNESAAVIPLPDDAGTLALHIRLHPDDVFDRYRFTLVSSGGMTMASLDGLRAVSANGERTLTAMIPSDRLASGSYEIAIAGRTGSEPSVELGFHTLEIRRGH